jgi:hypothetical protein
MESSIVFLVAISFLSKVDHRITMFKVDFVLFCENKLNGYLTSIAEG